MARQKSKNARTTLREYAIVAILSVLIVWLLYAVMGIFRKEEIARHTVHDTQTALASLSARHDTLQGNLAYLATPRGQEASLRQDFGVAKPGEEVVIIVQPKEVVAPAPQNFWQKFTNFFGF
jgi:hypothetical protein